jgi:PadR family transcriptional regulator, regulatory protein PadR
MPKGRGYGRGRGRRQHIRRFLEPCLLVLLRKEESHGYNLINGLYEFGFDSKNMDPSVLYRSLRDLESQGLITGQWDTNSLGPQRRVYTITSAGEAVLADWIAELRQTRQQIMALDNAYQGKEICCHKNEI